MRMTPENARRRLATARVARLATTRHGEPRVVPIVFVLDGDTIYTAIDHKPKTTLQLRRLDDIAAEPAVCVLVDHYEDDWTRLWWVRADGTARVLDDGADAARHALDLLVAKYDQYADARPPGPVIAIDVTRWSGWSGDA